MERSARKLLAYLVVSPLGLLPIAGCGNTDAPPAAQIESQQGIPPLFISGEDGMRSIGEPGSILPLKATLAERIVIHEPLRRLPPVEDVASRPNNDQLNVADTRSTNGYAIIPLPPVTESTAPADDTPYMASLPQSVVVQPQHQIQESAASSAPLADDELADLNWPEDESQSESDYSSGSADEFAGTSEELSVDPLEAEIASSDTVHEIRSLPPVLDLPEEEPAPTANVTGLVKVPEVEQTPAVEQIAPSDSGNNADSARSKAMRIVSEQAARHVRRGMSLASRGAPYSARSEFIFALRLVSQALDVSNNTHAHTEALSNGLRALEEADDFVPRGTQLEADLNLAILIRSHRTPVLKEEDADSLRAIFARQSYYNYAQEQLAFSVKGDRSGSMALFGLAKMRTTLAKQAGDSAQLELPKAMALHQAALLTDSDNFMASNELGVLLARYGQYESARSLLEHSVQVHPQAESWHNLAVVYQHLGHRSQVAQARRNSETLAKAQRTNRTAHREIVWKPVREFGDSAARTQAPVARKPVKPSETESEKR